MRHQRHSRTSLLSRRRITQLAVAAVFTNAGGLSASKSTTIKVADSTRPGSTNTGYRNAPGYPGTLTPFTGSLRSNTTYSFKSFIGGIDVGTSSVALTGVKFFGCLFKAAGDVLVRLYGDNHTFDYCSFEPNVAASPASYSSGYQYGLCANGGWYTNVGKLTVTNCDMWGFANGIDCIGSTQAKPHVFRNNWIHDARADGGVDHTDGIGFMGGSGSSSYVVVDNNVIESVGNTNGIAWQGGTYDHFTITNNLISGWGYAVNISGTTSNMTFTDNVFSTRLKCDWGPLYPSSFWVTAGSIWRRNKWMVPVGAAWGNPAHDGWFWRPTGGGSGTASDTPYVSQVDP
jgi:hypothetical protein